MTATTVSEEDIVELCKLGIGEVKKMMWPDTTRILLAFDAMMSKVKGRSSQKRHPEESINKALERCFVPFAGRGKTVVGVHEFASSLSVLSMKWSGNFSGEEYLALAQVIADEGTPGFITLESFKYAADVGVVALATSARPCANANQRKTRAEHYPQKYNRRDNGCEVVGLEGVRNKDNVMSVLTRTDGEAAAEHGREQEEGGGELAFSKDAVGERLNLVASEARLAGRDVWTMLDAAVLAHVVDERAEGAHESESEAKRRPLTADALRQFLTELNIRILPAHPHDNFPVINQVEATTRAGQEFEDRVYTGNSDSLQSLSPPPPPPPSSLCVSGSNGETQGLQVPESRLQEGSIADRYARSISPEATNARSRVQFFIRELNKTSGEAEVLISQVVKPSELKASLPDDTPKDDASGRIFENSSSDVFDEVHDFPPSRTTGVAMVKIGANPEDRGGSCSRSPYEVVQVSTGSSMQGSKFCRVSPVHRPDAGHPRVRIERCSSRDHLAAARVARGEDKTPQNASVAFSIAHGQKARTVKRTTGSRNCNHRSATFHETCFDPPDVRNGLKGLTRDHVDKVLLQVDTSIPGSKSCWKSLDIKERRRKRGKTESDIARHRPRERGRTRARVLGSECGSQGQPALLEQDQSPRVRWERLCRVIRTPATARPLPADRKNMWDKEKMKWVSPRDRNDKNPVDRPRSSTSGSHVSLNRVPFSADTTFNRSLRWNIVQK